MYSAEVFDTFWTLKLDVDNELQNKVEIQLVKYPQVIYFICQPASDSEFIISVMVCLRLCVSVCVYVSSLLINYPPTGSWKFRNLMCVYVFLYVSRRFILPH